MPDVTTHTRPCRVGRLIALAMIFWGLAIGKVQANCHALRNLPDIVIEVENLAWLTDDSAIARSGTRLAALRQQVNKNTMYQMLEPIGLEFSLPEIMRLKVKLGALSEFAVQNGLRKTYDYMRGSDFLRSYDPVRSLVLQHCAASSPGYQGRFGRPVYASLSGHMNAAAVAPANVAGGPEDASDTKPRNVTAGETLLGAGTISVIIAGIVAMWLGHQQRRWRRQSKRHACDIAVAIKTGAETLRCTAVDLSQSGANLEIEVELAADQSVTIEFGPLSRKATVVWSNSKYAGLRFAHRLRRTEFVETLELSTLAANVFTRPSNKKATPERASLETMWARGSAALASAFKQLRQ